MYLLCQCGARQPVTTADEADEDARTQAIRREFRREHLASCGERTVSFQWQDVTAPPPVDMGPQPWMSAAPAGVTMRGDGYFYTSDGVRVCEDCWQPIPRYLDFPLGLGSPESDSKVRGVAVSGEGVTTMMQGYEHLIKAVCVPCYRLAFARVYPDVALPELREDIFGDQKLGDRAVLVHQTTIDAGYIGEPRTA